MSRRTIASRSVASSAPRNRMGGTRSTRCRRTARVWVSQSGPVHLASTSYPGYRVDPDESEPAPFPLDDATDSSLIGRSGTPECQQADDGEAGIDGRCEWRRALKDVEAE